MGDVKVKNDGAVFVDTTSPELLVKAAVDFAQTRHGHYATSPLPLSVPAWSQFETDGQQLQLHIGERARQIASEASIPLGPSIESSTTNTVQTQVTDWMDHQSSFEHGQCVQ